MTNKERHNISELLAKYRSNTISEEEFRQFKASVNSSTDKDLFLLLNSSWNDERLEDEPSACLIDQDKDEILDKINKEVVYFKRKSTLFTWIPRVAALLIIGLIGYFSYHSIKEKELEIANLMSKKISFHVGAGERVTLTLPDSSIVHLNSNSMLSYQQDFGMKDRKVNLIGEGYFEVSHDKTKKFIVNTGFFDVEVLGTKFNINAYKENKLINLTLLSGSVRVKTFTKPVETVKLVPNEKLLYNKHKSSFQVRQVDNDVDIAWTKKFMRFNSKPLFYVLQSIAVKYGVKFEIDDVEILKDKYTGRFDTENIEEVMKILRFNYKFNYEIHGNKIHISIY